MFAWIQPRTRPPPVGDATPLLQHLAGAFAARVAGLWPAPHTEFITAPAERRHLVCIAIARAGDGPVSITPAYLLTVSLKEAVAYGVPDAPDGLRRALGRLGETAWSAEDYDRLLFVLAQGAKDVRHAEVITAEQVRALAALPAPLIAARVGGFGLTVHQARLLAELHGLVQSRFGQEAAGAAAVRWAGARKARDLFDMAEDDLLPELPPPPFPGSERLRPLTTKAAIREAAARFHNCLRTRIASVARGDAAIYEWVGPHPVAVELSRDPIHGWSLTEARGVRNVEVREPLRSKILAELREMGVHVGRTSWDLRRQIESAHEPWWVYEEPDREIGWLFGAD